jgi:hypothetical protein
MLSRLNSSIRVGSLSARIQSRIAQERAFFANWTCCKPYSEPLSGSTATNSTKNEITPTMNFAPKRHALTHKRVQFDFFDAKKSATMVMPKTIAWPFANQRMRGWLEQRSGLVTALVLAATHQAIAAMIWLW